MDSVQLILLYFLLLTAAPHSNTAMPSANRAERTQDSSTGETNVTVYRCRGHVSSVCDDKSSYEGCEKIVDTRNNTFSDKAFRLELSETSIILCCRYPEYVPEGVIGIVWHKAKGIGGSCGAVNCEVSSENVTGGITETCCEAEINFDKPKSLLKCYHKMAGNRESSADITDEGNVENPQPVIDEQSSSSAILVPVLLVIVCGAAVGVYCVRRRRKGRAVGKNHRQAPDIHHTYLRNIYS